MEKITNTSRGLQITGVAASPGIAIGRAFVMPRNEMAATAVLLSDDEEVQRETKRFDNAVSASVEEVEKMIGGGNLKKEEAEILDTHIEFLSDPQIRADVVDCMAKNKKNATDAVMEVIRKAATFFQNMDDEYMRARAADIRDVGNRILKKLNPSWGTNSFEFGSNTVVFAEDITPSETIAMDLEKVIGFATSVGGKTSHTAILAKSKGIPAVLGVGPLAGVENDDLVIVDGLAGLIIVNPDSACLEEYQTKKKAYDHQTELLNSLKDIPAVTTDGFAITLLANISIADEIEEALEQGAEGAGLFRTELLFMNRNSFPGEEEQFVFYKTAALKARSKPVIVRTIDIGGDKPLPYFGLPREENPFLGYRAIRICLDRKDLFVTQLKAILRASTFGNLRIMFPMISSVQELRLAKRILEEAKNELLEQGVAFNKSIPVGIMIEVPSAAVTADILAKEVDFFSIGTNDLCQYTLAVDRVNEKIKALYDPFNPAVLRLIRYCIDQGRLHNIDVGMCGELASDPAATLLLVGMGLHEFSMSASSIATVKNVILKISHSRAKEVCQEVMGMDNSNEIKNYLNNIT